MKHDDAIIAVFQVKPSTTKSKSTMSFTDISVIKNHEKPKFQEIVSFHYNQKLPLEKKYLVGLELDTNPQIADILPTAVFILSCFQSVSLHLRAGDKDILPSWVCVRSLLSSAKVKKCMLVFFHSFLNP